MVSFGLAGTPAEAVPLAFSFEFDAPDFTKPELDPLEQLLTSNGISKVTGTLSYVSEDTDFVTSNFSPASNIDAVFKRTPGELVSGNTGKLNQVRSWETHIAGVRYILELMGLDPTEPSPPNLWFGGMVLDFTEVNVYDLTAAAAYSAARCLTVVSLRLWRSDSHRLAVWDLRDPRGPVAWAGQGQEGSTKPPTRQFDIISASRSGWPRSCCMSMFDGPECTIFVQAFGLNTASGCQLRGKLTRYIENQMEAKGNWKGERTDVGF
jgi:hypothetical protein